MTWQTSSTSSDETEQLGERIGRALKGGEVIELVSDLGGGKTTFVRGLARGAGSIDKVASPTFTISRVYTTDRLRFSHVHQSDMTSAAAINPNDPPQPIEIHHFDFYRLHEPGVVADELAELAGDAATVVIVEWADAVQHVLPPKRLTIRIEQTPTGTRRLSLRAPETLDYLVRAAV